jgi:hypothetical protein
VTRQRSLLGLVVPTVLVLTLLVLTGCSTASPTAAGDASSSDTTTATPGVSPSSPVDSASTSATGQDAGVGTGAGVVDAVSGAILPNPVRTPGVLNAEVTQADIFSTICVSGWTATIRPPSGYTTQLKQRQLATGYAFNGDTVTGDYEEDHLISLELGGSPTSPMNLWPEPYSSADGARVKDQLENKLHQLVCAGSIQLAQAQQAIASNWWVAYETYIRGDAPQTAAPAVPAPPAAAPAAPGLVPSGATARCNDGSYSFAAHHQGACSHGGGVAVFYN